GFVHRNPATAAPSNARSRRSVAVDTECPEQPQSFAFQAPTYAQVSSEDRSRAVRARAGSAPEVCRAPDPWRSAARPGHFVLTAPATWRWSATLRLSWGTS